MSNLEEKEGRRSKVEGKGMEGGGREGEEKKKKGGVRKREKMGRGTGGKE